LLKSKLSGADFGKVVEAVPGSDSLADETAAKARGAEGGGGGANDLMSSAMGMFGKKKPAEGGTAEGGIEDIPQLLSFLGGLGIDSKDIMKFLPTATKYLSENANVDASSALGVPGGEAAEDLANKAKGFMSSFTKK
jgi:hypothetical protein